MIGILRDDQRVTMTLPGRKQVIRGPGIVLRLPLIHRDWTVHTVGDRGHLQQVGVGVFNGVEVPVEIEDRASRTQTVRIVRFVNARDGARFVVGP